MSDITEEESSNDTWDNDESNEEAIQAGLQSHAYRRKIRNTMLLATIATCEMYYQSYIAKQPCRTSALSGKQWVEELLDGHHIRIEQAFKMNRRVFLDLCELLIEKYEFTVTNKEGDRVIVSPYESIAMFLYTIAKAASNRDVQERFQHSGETVHRHFHLVLESMKHFAADMCKPRFPQSYKHPYLSRRTKYKPFEGCIGAIDGTHVMMRPTSENPIPYYGRKGYYTHNIIAACDFDLCFSFVSTGWEGSMHDTAVFKRVTAPNSGHGFPMPELGKFYLVDSGYPNTKGFLAPYRGERYHLQEYRMIGGPRNAIQRFNEAHSSLRSAIERAFGVWKARWGIIRNMLQFSTNDQSVMLGVSMALHNFIRRHNIPDDEYPEIVEIYNDSAYLCHDFLVTTPTSDENPARDDSEFMAIKRDEIRDELARLMVQRRTE